MISIKGKVQMGVFSNDTFLQAQLQRFEGKQIEIQIRTKKIKRTEAQNRLLWGRVYSQASAKSGHTSMDVHTGMSVEFLSYQDAMGMTHVRSTTDLSTVEMTDYIERVCSFFGLPIPGEWDDGY